MNKRHTNKRHINKPYMDKGCLEIAFDVISGGAVIAVLTGICIAVWIAVIVSIMKLVRWLSHV